MPTIVLATGNKGKIRELSEMLRASHPDLTVLGLKDFPEIGEIPETGETFEENALIKARAVCAATGLVAVADDSGLVVDGLGGAPGVYSARYSGAGATDHSNLARVLAELECVEDSRRTARFMCVIAACAPNGATLVAEGFWEGRIIREPLGENGFGYDPVFWDDELQCSAAQMAPEVKNGRSHRGRALRSLMAEWDGFWVRSGQ
jgi:XTP/dITP diphosphohydrolase